MTNFKINEHLTVECEYYKTRYSWGHKGWLYRDGQGVGYKKIVYQNRTWERYTFESLLRCLAEDKRNGLTPTERGLFYKQIETEWKAESDKNVEQEFKTIGMIATLGNIFCQTKEDKNNWKARMLKAGLTGLDMPEDWETLSEDDKETRLNAVINNLNGGLQCQK